jgi:hypothetical protein
LFFHFNWHAGPRCGLSLCYNAKSVVILGDRSFNDP